MLYSKEAEETVLGCMMLDKKATSVALSRLCTNDIYVTAHQIIFDSISEISATHQIPDLITVSDKLQQKNQFDAIGGYEELVRLCNNVITTEQLSNSINVIKGKAVRRKYIDAGKRIVEIAQNGEFDTILDMKNSIHSAITIDSGIEQRETSKAMDVVMEYVDDLEQRSRGKITNLIPWGIPWLDNKTGGARNQSLIIIAARPSVGKTAFTLQLARNMATKGKKVAFFSLEMSKHQLMERVLANVSNVNSHALKMATLTDEYWRRVGIAMTEISQYNVHLYDKIFGIEGIKAMAMELRATGQMDVMFVDYLQLVGTTKKYSGENEKVTHISREFKLLAKQLDIPVVVLSQLRRLEGKNSVPTLQDLRSSGAIEQDADDVLFLHDPKYGEVDNDKADAEVLEICIGKQRSGERDISKCVQYIKSIQRIHQQD